MADAKFPEDADVRARTGVIVGTGSGHHHRREHDLRGRARTEVGPDLAVLRADA